MGPVTHDIYLIGVVILIICSIPATIVPLFYLVAFPWRQYDEGKAVMVATTGLALLVDLALLFRIVDVPLIVLLSIADLVYAIITAGAIYKLVVLIRNWVKGGGWDAAKAYAAHVRDAGHSRGKSAWARLRALLHRKD